MRGARPRSLRSLWAAVGALSLGVLLVGSAPAGAQESGLVPIVFVHGGAGSGAQYETQARRFDSNGYPARYVRAFEYDSSFATNTFAQVIERLDATVDDLRAEFGVERVYLVGHSLGTTVSNTYLSNAGRAAKIAKYIGIDGSSNATCGVDRPEPRLHGNLAGHEHDGQRGRQQRPPQPADARAGRRPPPSRSPRSTRSSRERSRRRRSCSRSRPARSRSPAAPSCSRRTAGRQEPRWRSGR